MPYSFLRIGNLTPASPKKFSIRIYCNTQRLLWLNFFNVGNFFHSKPSSTLLFSLKLLSNKKISLPDKNRKKKTPCLQCQHCKKWTHCKQGVDTSNQYKQCIQ